MTPDPTDLTERLEACHAAAVHDVLRAMGHARCVLPPEIRALDPARKLHGGVKFLSGQGVPKKIRVRLVGVFNQQARELQRVYFPQKGTRGLSLVWIHPHIEGTFEFQGKAPLRVVQLH